MLSSKPSPQDIHPALWRASQLAHSPGIHLDTGYPALTRQLPGQGWALGQLTELLIGQPGIGELQLLLPALGRHAKNSLIMVQPPHTPHIAAWTSHGLQPAQCLWLKPACNSDALWATEQALRSNAFEALLLWQLHNTINRPALQRLHLAARHSQTLFMVFRPVSTTRIASPAPLRLVLHSASHGLDIRLLKRRGNTYPKLIPIHLHSGIRFHESDHASLDRRASAPGQPRPLLSPLAG